ncbi:polysaccharide pyruvyl transferase family protein (plasmid) [Priestia aryabhattai]|uniref:polysaccharide pyruvyl transferase family protein n=1 Tax=Priestia aryabhattai TaxID=412384 RepID=UPI003D7FB605
MKKVLYIGWIGFGNLGDDLLWNIFKNLSKQYLDEKQIKIIPSFSGIDINKVEDYDTIVLGGGSLLTPRYIHILYKSLEIGKKIIIWGSGIDRIKKQKLDNILSGSLPSLEQEFIIEDATILKNVFSGASFAGVRGPLTQKALELLGVSKDDIQVIGDPGLLLKPVDKVNIEKKEKLIGLNWGTTYKQLYGNSEIGLENKLVIVSKKLIEQGYKILIYTVWSNDLRACQRLFNKINDAQNVTFDKKLYTEQELISILSSCNLTINFKLHPNLLSLAANVPSIALGYRFKVFDLAYLLGLESYALSTDSPKLEEEILKRVNLIEKNKDSILRRYGEIQNKYHPLLVKPFYEGLYT